MEALVREEGIAGNGSKSLEEDAEVTYEVAQGREVLEAKKISMIWGVVAELAAALMV